MRPCVRLCNHRRTRPLRFHDVLRTASNSSEPGRRATDIFGVRQHLKRCTTVTQSKPEPGRSCLTCPARIDEHRDSSVSHSADRPLLSSTILPHRRSKTSDLTHSFSWPARFREVLTQKVRGRRVCLPRGLSTLGLNVVSTCTQPFGETRAGAYHTALTQNLRSQNESGKEIR